MNAEVQVASALQAHSRIAERALQRETGRWETHFCSPKCAAAILALLPAGWCGHDRDAIYAEGYLARAAEIEAGNARLRDIEDAARRWWESKRPVGWDEEMHRQCSFVNTSTDAEEGLAALFGAGEEE
jgi:hypothetical protein